MKRVVSALAMALANVAAAQSGDARAWKLVWSDEFDKPGPTRPRALDV